MRRRTMPRWAAVAFLAIGLYVVLLSLGVIEAHARPGARRGLLASPQHWAVTAIGLAFVGAGLSVGFPAAPRRWLRLNAALTAGCFVAAMVWFVYFTGMPLAEKLLFTVPLLLGLGGMVWGVAQSLRGRGDIARPPRRRQ